MTLARRCVLAMLVLVACDRTPGSDDMARQASPIRNGRVALSTTEQATLPRDMRALGVRSLLDVPRSMAYGGFVWNEAGAASGPVRVSVDLRRQLMSVFRGGDEIGTAVILYGADGRPTPRGRFPVLAKLKDHRSSLYDAPMPYTLRLTGDGVSIHGSNVRRAAATHGCIGIPAAFAGRLFTVIRRGDLVVIG